MTKKEQKYINSLKEENERVKNLLLRFVVALGKLKNLDDVVNMSLIPIMTEENQKIRAEIKAEAYKECIEKVKEEIAEALESNYKARAERIDKHNVGDKTDFISYCGGKIDCLRGLDDFLDNLLKEMVGDI